MADERPFPERTQHLWGLSPCGAARNLGTSGHGPPGDAPPAGRLARRAAASMTPRWPLLRRQLHRALEQQGVDEGLGEVAAELALADVELLGEQAGGAAGGAVALEPGEGEGHIALLSVGEREPEATEEEGALGLAERQLFGLEAVAVAVLGQLPGDRVQRRLGARVRGGDGPADRRQQQRGVAARGPAG